MAVSVYILLEAVEGKCESVVRALRSSRGVVSVQPLEGSSEVVVQVKGADRLEMARLANLALYSVNDRTARIHLLPVKANQ